MKIPINTKAYLRQVSISAFFWGLSLGFFAVFRYLGINRAPDIELSCNIRALILTNMATLTVLGAVLGMVYASIEYFFEKSVSKSLGWRLQLFIKIMLDLLITLGLLRLSLIITQSNGTKEGWLSWLNNERIESIMLYIFFCSFFVFFLMKIAAERFGKAVFFKMLLGKYRTPKEEDRIFMFLDLKNSTTIAEQLGHFRYSQFIQDCFHDLNKLVLKYEAEIYQYVGDEVVLTWPYLKGITNNNCIGLFFNFQQQLLSKNKYYLDKFGTCPQFKAGIHGGSLMIAEVGFVKKQLAYHGDVINTSARIQKQCNNYNVPLLLSEKLINDLNIQDLLTSKYLGNVLLKGKSKEVKIYSLLV
ncbi:MAG: adenylate/guanylate cyclase domain-containing protein [Bacteroidota bacterium]